MVIVTLNVKAAIFFAKFNFSEDPEINLELSNVLDEKFNFSLQIRCNHIKDQLSTFRCF